MRIGRAIGIQTLTTSLMFLLLVAAVSFYWVRMDSGQAKIRDDAITLRDYRLLSEVVSGWVLSGDLVFSRDQTDMIEAGLRQGEQIVSLATELSSEPLALQFNNSFAEAISLVEGSSALLVQARQLQLGQIEYLYPLWEASSQEVIRQVVGLGEVLIAASEENSRLAAEERSRFIVLIASGCAIFSLLIFVLWRWVTHLIVEPLGRLTNGAREALQAGSQMQRVSSSVDEIGSLTQSISDFTQSLSDRVEERTLQLRQQQELLKQENELRKQAEKAAQTEAVKATAANRAKGQFLANMSHELRTPLNAILGGAQLLGIMELKPDARDWAQRIEDSGNHLLALLNAVLDYSQLNDGDFELSHDKFSVANLLQHCRSVFADNVGQSKLSFTLEADPELPEQLIGDNIRIQQILAHLIGNAVKFTELGTVGVRVTATRLSETQVRLDWAVADTGIGIEEANLGRIFDYFEQEDNSDARKYGGSGLGLAISRELARMMGGDITVKSKPGLGSIFQCSMVLDSCEVVPSSGDAVTARGLAVASH